MLGAHFTRSVNVPLTPGSKFFLDHAIPCYIEISPSFHGLSTPIPNGIGLHAEGNLSGFGSSIEQSYTWGPNLAWTLGKNLKDVYSLTNCEIAVGLAGPVKLSGLVGYQPLFVKVSSTLNTHFTFQSGLLWWVEQSQHTIRLIFMNSLPITRTFVGVGLRTKIIEALSNSHFTLNLKRWETKTQG